MSNNLFVCHTQANLILAVGLVKVRFSEMENHLILFKDFNLSKEMKTVLDKVFFRTLYREGTYPAFNKSWKAKFKRIPNDIKAIETFLISRYENVFVICDDALPEIYILKRASFLNPSVNLIWLEDGSYPYYLNISQNTGFNKNIFTRLTRKLIFKYLFGLGKFYDYEGNFMGANKNIKSIYVTFKNYERDIYKNKQKIAITEKEFQAGIRGLFLGNGSFELKEKAVILVIDKLDTYKDLNLLKKYIVNIINILKGHKLKLYYKFHPREEEYLQELNSITSLDKNLAIEFYYASNLGKNLTVLGVKSTGLQYSKKLNFKSISFANIVNEKNENLLSFYNKIGVLVPNSFEGLIKNLIE